MSRLTFEYYLPPDICGLNLASCAQGRLHSRALDGPVKFPTGPKDLMVKVEQIYIAFFKVWIASMVPKLIPQPKWFKESPKLKPGDIIYFKKN